MVQLISNNGNGKNGFSKENKIVGIVSAKGGVGKTTTAINLGAAALDTFKKSVLLIDVNLDTGNLALNLGLSPSQKSMKELTKDSLTIINSVHKHKSGLHIIPSSYEAEETKLDPISLRKKLKALKNYDLIILDSAPGVAGDARTAIKASDILVLVLTPDIPSIGTAIKTVQVARKHDIPIAGIVLNKVRGKSYELNKTYIETALNLPIIATIPDDKYISEAVSKRLPVVLHKRRARSSIAYKKLSAHIFGKTIRRKPIILQIREAVLGKKK
jgi:septum site-determining protein MinD